MIIPEAAKRLILRLNEAGYEAYAVGGCVRDSLLGREPMDWDICTSALPEETARCFSALRVVATGLKHGTVTVVLDGEGYEITTFRRDGAYADHRRPDSVEFVTNLEEDLKRRDFTINAMAARADGVIMDPCGGQSDLALGIIRCVGDADTRFEEDALRILRALRFSSQLGFAIAPETALAMERKKELLRFVSGERVLKEVNLLLVGKDAKRVLGDHISILTEVFPEIKPCIGFQQKSIYHNMDVWNHTLEALGISKPELYVRWALLLHDLGKPDCFTVDENGRGHFYGHPARSEELAREIFARLHADNRMRNIVCQLVASHDFDRPASKKAARQWVSKFGPEVLRLLLEVKRCDYLAHADTPKTRTRYDNLVEMTALCHQAMEEEKCFSVRDLAVSGNDLMKAGIPTGPKIGKVLSCLLSEVQGDETPNEREALMRRVKAFAEKGYLE